MKLSEFNYNLPKALIAQYPHQNRDQSRLLVIERKSKRIAHKHFTDIINYFAPGDTLVLNNTKVLYARMVGRREKSSPCTGGGTQEIFFLENISQDVYRVLANPAKKLTRGVKVLFGDGAWTATVVAEEGMTKTLHFKGDGKMEDVWNTMGEVPLPPYIKRKPKAIDKERYQTVYAEVPGATAAPTAGLHFTQGLLRTIQDQGVNVSFVTLHINYATFSPVKCEDIEKHKMYKEYFVLPQDTAEIINDTKRRGNKVYAVGTTSARVLETVATEAEGEKPQLHQKQGWTDLFIYPPYTFKAVDCLLTNFHFPKSTLLILVSAFGTKELILKAYQEAIQKKYRFFSYGDAMLII